MSGERPCWNSDATSATVLMEYLKRVSPEFVAVELDKLGLLDAADQAAATVLEEVVALRASDRVLGHAVRRLSENDVERALRSVGIEAEQLDKNMAAFLRTRRIRCRDDVGIPVASALPHKVAAVVTLAMCAMMVVLAHTRLLGSMNVPRQDDSGQLMQLAGPTPEW